MNPRDAYLAWQADIGTEEVVLAQPWVKPRPRHPSPQRPDPETQPSSSTFASARHDEGTAARAPAAPTHAENFFQSIAAVLSRPEPFAGRSRPARALEPPPPPTAVANEIPEFRDLEAYWAFLESVYPAWYPGVSSKLARAQGVPRPVLAVVEFSPSLTSGARVFAGEQGEYLDRMLKAIGLDRSQLYLTSVMKTPPPGKAWSRRDAARMLPAFLRELKLAQCGLVLLLGELCAQTVMRTGQGLLALEEQAVNLEDLAFTATWHPEELLKDQDQSLRRSAWKHLQWVRARLPAAGH
jgi:uracil-DNA glycosylase family 4